MKGKLLVFCPDKDVTNVFSSTLEPWGHRLTYAGNIEEYIAEVKKGPWDIIFIDVRIHKLPYQRVFSEARKTQPEAEIVVLTGHSIPDPIVKPDFHELCGFLILPLNADKVKNLVNRLLARLELVTENKRLLIAITAAKKEWEATVDAIEDPIVVTDFDYTILRANLATFRRLGRGFNEVVGKKFHKLFYLTDAPPEDCPSRKARDTGETATATVMLKGLKERLKLSVYPQVFAAGGGLVHILQPPSSGTEQEAETMAKYERLFTEAAVPILLVNVDDMKVVEANAKAFELFGRDPESMSDLDLENLFAPAQREATISGILNQIKEPSTGVLKTKVLDNLGNEMDVSLSTNPIEFGAIHFAEIFVTT
jgi:PAS domain S-box-containing protein